MAYQYEDNSPKASRGYAEPERKYNETVNYQPKSTGFADNLESQYYYDRPAVSQDRMQEKMQEITKEPERPYNFSAQNNNYRQNSYQQSNNYQNNNQQNYQNNDNYRYENVRDSYNSAQQENPQRDNYRQSDYERFEEQRNHALGTRYAKDESQEPFTQSGMRYTTDEAKPSATTLQFASEESVNDPFENYREKGESVDKKYTINTKGKILIAVYALVVITVFALIILNTRLLKTMNATSKAKEGEIAKLSEEVNNLYSELDYVSSDEVIEEKAAEKGMIKG